MTPGDKARLVALADATGQAQSNLVRHALHRLFAAHDLIDRQDGNEHALDSVPSVATLSRLESRLDDQLDEVRAAVDALLDAASPPDDVAPEDSPV